MPERKSGVLVVAALVPALVLGLVLSLILLGGDDSDDLCLPGSQQPGITIDPDSVPDTPIAGYNHEQLVNAAWIMQAANALGLSARDQTIGVMTAMGESSLRVIDYGDAVGPDSRGLLPSSTRSVVTVRSRTATSWTRWPGRGSCSHSLGAKSTGPR